MKKILPLLLFLPLAAVAQFGKGIGIEPTIHIGRIIKHTPKLNFDIDHVSYGLELNLTSQKYGKKAWHHPLNYPVVGVDLFYYRLGESGVFGDAIGLFPNVSLRVFQKNRFDLRFQGGLGIAYLTTHYDAIENPENNAIGSHFNNITAAKWQLYYRFTPQIQFHTGVSFTHFSNGASQLPNFGINVLAYAIGFRYTPKVLQTTDFIEHPTTELFLKRWGLDLHLGIGYRENLVPGGPKYPIYIASVQLRYQNHPVHRLMAGLEYEFNRAVYTLGWHTFQFNSESDARQQSSRLALTLGDELLFGNVGFSGQLGFYLPINSWLLPAFFYTKFGLRYYLPPLGRPKTRFYAGIHIKSHNITAEYFSFGLGATF
ncbi:MAG: acyloxyacyl hydrolase [Bacteroidota bacterium]